MYSEQSQSVFERVESERSIRLCIDGMAKGIDNYHIDVRLSRKFSSDVKKLVALLIAQIAVPNPRSWDNSQVLDKFRDRYLDLMTMLIHRVKTDLGPEQICFLQFAPIKHVVRISRSQLDEEIRQISARLAEHRHKGSSEALATQQRLFWLKKNYDAILYEVNRHVFSQMQRVEERQLQSIRAQYLGEEYDYMVAALINPLLYPSELSALPLLLQEFSAWSWNSEDSGFVDLNLQVEKLFAKRLQVLGETTLRQAIAQDSMALEIHDELGGLFRSQAYLGQAEDTKTVIDAKFNWFDLPENIELLFNIRQTTERLANIRKEEGFKAWWSSMLDARRLAKTLKDFSALLRKSNLLPQLLSSHYMRLSLIHI